jgi:DNA ligase-1
MEFLKIAELFEGIEKTSARLEMTDQLSGFFKALSAESAPSFVYLLQGKLGPDYSGIKIGMGEKFVVEAIAKVTGFSKETVEKKFRETGDLGETAFELVQKKKQQSFFSASLTLRKVHENLLKIAKAEGMGSQDSKIRLLAELLNSAKPVEAKFIVRFPLEELRLGVGDPTIMDALALNLVNEFRKEHSKETGKIEEELKTKKPEERKEELVRKIRVKIREKIEEKYNVHPDLGFLAQKLLEKGLPGLKEIGIEVGIPIRPTLAERLPSTEEIVEKLGKCAVESKFDGFRLQIHKKGETITVFSRQSENVTNMFPDIAKGVREQIKATEAIFEGEAIAYNEQTREFYSFQVTIQRKRKYGIEEKSEEFPLKLFCFDVMYADGKNWMPFPFRERRKQLEKMIAKGPVVQLTDSIITDDPKKMESFFEESIERGLEGIIAKDLNAHYIAGARKFAWIKLKRSYKGELQDSVDAVIVGYYKGKGKRTRFGLGGLLTAVYDKEKDLFKTIAKIGTGMSEETLQELEKRLSKIALKKKPARLESELEADEWCTPHYVIEVRADEITKSPMHTAGKKRAGDEGFALRFPRMIQFRSDKKPEEATSEKEIRRMFENQKHVQIQSNTEMP